MEGATQEEQDSGILTINLISKTPKNLIVHLVLPQNNEKIGQYKSFAVKTF